MSREVRRVLLELRDGMAIKAIPSGFRNPLLTEYRNIVQNFLERRWLPAELHGGRFSETVYTILDGQAKKSYATTPTKPPNFVAACRGLEKNKLAHVPYSFQILIPRLLPALYDVSNTDPANEETHHRSRQNAPKQLLRNSRHL